MHHSIEIQERGLIVDISVLLESQIAVLEHGVVVSPGWVGDVERGVGEEGAEELESNAQGACSRYSLANGDLSPDGLLPLYEIFFFSSIRLRKKKRLTLFSLIAGCSAPRTNLMVSSRNSASPSCGKYSLLRSEFAICFSI